MQRVHSEVHIWGAKVGHLLAVAVVVHLIHGIIEHKYVRVGLRSHYGVAELSRPRDDLLDHLVEHHQGL